MQLLVLLGVKSCGSRYRLTMRLTSSHTSYWNVQFAGNWDSALQKKSALRAHVSHAAGIELAQKKGPNVIPFVSGRCGILRQHQSSFIDTATYNERGPCSDLDLDTGDILTHRSPGCLQVGDGVSDVIAGCTSRILAGGLQT